MTHREAGWCFQMGSQGLAGRRVCLHCIRSMGSDSGLSPSPPSIHTQISLTWGSASAQDLGPAGGSQSPSPAESQVQALSFGSMDAGQAPVPSQNGCVVRYGPVSTAVRPGAGNCKPRFAMQCRCSSEGLEPTSPQAQVPQPWVYTAE